MPILTALSEAVGHTPLVRLRSLEAEAPGVQILAKVDWFNPGGSVKDRAALGIVQELVARGILTRGGTRALLDSTSGNTGVAYAWIGASLGLKVALVMPENVSAARKQLAARFGAEIIFSDAQEQSDGAIRLARKLSKEQPDRYVYADQYSNLNNPGAHEKTTAEELWAETGGALTHFVAGLGTTGTVMGTGRGLKGKNPGITIIAVEPDDPFHALEGLKHLPSSIVPPIYRESGHDRKLLVSTDDGWDMADRLIRDEGLLAGHSAGAAAMGALRIAKELSSSGTGGCVACLLPDRADRYLPPPP
ncbi:MAG: cysteine synthase family protein [Deltaproteobacteria bacterium]|nr:cysteine synthase family protein [Deltaproteobacteria bacterium]